MRPEERQLILDLFDRIGAVPTRDNDVDVEQLIRDAVARDPNSPYVLVQSVLVQEEALRRADERIRQLENSTAVSGSRGPRSFLDSGSRVGEDMSGGSVPNSGPRGRDVGTRPREAIDDQPPRPQAHGGSFLGNALSTAGGVAGGMLLADSIRSLFGGGQSSDIFGRSAEAKDTTAEKPAGEPSVAEDKSQTDNAPSEDAAQDLTQDGTQDAEFDQDFGWGDDDSFDI